MVFNLANACALLLAARMAAANLPTNERWASQDDIALLQGTVKHSSNSGKVDVLKKDRKQSSALGQCIEQYADGLDALHEGLGHTIRAHPQTVVATSPRDMIFAAQPGKTGSRSLLAALTLIAQQYNETWKVSHQKTTTKNNAAWLCSLFDTLTKAEPECLSSLRSFDFTGVSGDVGAMVADPVFQTFIDFYLAFPEARWIVTPRPSDDWAESYTFQSETSFWPLQEPCGVQINMIEEYPQFKAQMYELTSAFVACVIPREKMFVLDIFQQSTEGVMKRLREFLGYPANDFIDKADYPNTGEMNSIWYEEGLISACGAIDDRQRT